MGDLATWHYFFTSDLVLASTLCCLGYDYKVFQSGILDKTVLAFKRDDNIDKLVRDYHNRYLKVEHSSFSNFFKEAERRIEEGE